MSKYYRDPIVDQEESRRTMKTPESIIIDIPPWDDIMFYDPSADSQEIPFDRNEWLISELQSGRRRAPRQNEFLRLLLENPRYSSYASWIDKNNGLFEILLPEEVTLLWKKVKNRQTNGELHYPIFSRGLRYYYKTGLMIKTHKKYTFCFNQSVDDMES